MIFFFFFRLAFFAIFSNHSVLATVHCLSYINSPFRGLRDYPCVLLEGVRGYPYVILEGLRGYSFLLLVGLRGYPVPLEGFSLCPLGGLKGLYLLLLEAVRSCSSVLLEG